MVLRIDKCGAIANRRSGRVEPVLFFFSGGEDLKQPSDPCQRASAGAVCNGVSSKARSGLRTSPAQVGNPSVAMSCVADRSVIEKAIAKSGTVCVGATKAMEAISAETRSCVGTLQPRRWLIHPH